MKHLFLLRHGKSDWTDYETLGDFKRPLAKRGRKAAARIGKYLNGSGFEPLDLVLCSSSERTRETWARVSVQLTGSDHVKVEAMDALYHSATTDSVVKLLREVEDDPRTIVVVGHFPWIMALANDLLERPGIDAFPTCALACIRCDIARWKNLETGSANNRLEHFVRPRSL